MTNELGPHPLDGMGWFDDEGAHIPLRDGSIYLISQQEIQRIANLYPGLDIPLEFRKMVGWCNGAIHNRKTRAGIRRFIYNWLNRAADRQSGARVSDFRFDALKSFGEGSGNGIR